MSRKYLIKPKMNISIFMDLVPMKGSEIEKIIIEDKIMESTLAIANYYATREIETNIMYDKQGLQRFSIHHRRDFLPFYHACAGLKYHGAIAIEQLVLAAFSKESQGRYSVIITHYLTKDLFCVAQQMVSRGAMVTIIWISDDLTEKSKQLKANLLSANIGIYQIMLEDEIDPILTGINK